MIITDFSRFTNKIKQNGIRWVLNIMWALIVNLVFRKRTLLILEKDLDKIDLAEAKINPEYKLISRNDIIKILNLKHLKEGILNEYLENKSKCLGAFWNDRVIGYCWVHFRKYYFPFFDYYLKIKDKEAYIGPAFVDPEFRGKRLYGALMSRLFVNLKKNGCLLVYGSVWDTNIASIKGVKKIGFLPVNYIKVIRIFKKIVYKKQGQRKFY